MRLRGDLNAELAEKRDEKSGTMGSSPGDVRAGNAASMQNDSMGYC